MFKADILKGNALLLFLIEKIVKQSSLIGGQGRFSLAGRRSQGEIALMNTTLQSFGEPDLIDMNFGVLRAHQDLLVLIVIDIGGAHAEEARIEKMLPMSITMRTRRS